MSGSKNDSPCGPQSAPADAHNLLPPQSANCRFSHWLPILPCITSRRSLGTQECWGSCWDGTPACTRIFTCGWQFIWLIYLSSHESEFLSCYERGTTRGGSNNGELCRKPRIEWAQRIKPSPLRGQWKNRENSVFPLPKGYILVSETLPPFWPFPLQQPESDHIHKNGVHSTFMAIFFKFMK